MKAYVGPQLVQEKAGAEAPLTFRTPFLAVDEFLPRRDATAMRSAVDAHFGETHKHSPDVHQVWTYWFVPGLYTYLRTCPEKVIARELVERFHSALTAWAKHSLGLGHVTWPNLSLYVDGCQQHLHNDSTNGRFGYVFSLTWDDRKTTGGETIVLREGDLFRGNMARAAAGLGLLDLIEPRFNRLALFDDRMPHGVQRVEGSMDPVEGRIVLHGHISESGPMAEGALCAADVAACVHAALAKPAERINMSPILHHGPVVLRLAILPSGEVGGVETLVDRLARGDGASPRELVEEIVSIAGSIRFPSAEGPTEATVPLLFGGDLPWMSVPR